MEIYTIGYTKRPAEEFFERLKLHGLRRVVDVRLNNTSQLAGFSKRDDLRYFLREICDADYLHEPRLAPTPELLRSYQDKQIGAEEYAEQFRRLLAERQPEHWLDRALFEQPTVLLCAEPEPDHCHRRLVAEHLREAWGEVRIIHL
jgi:uncharacterized protein (DUF488 family)